MSNSFSVRIVHFSNILEIEGARSTADFEGLLEAMEYGDQSDLSDSDKRELCLFLLQDQEPEEAAYIVLKRDLSDVLRDGQMRNIAAEILDEKLWEEYADSSLHERLFNVGSLLFEAFPRSFPEPDAVHLEIEVTAENAGSARMLTDELNESFRVRLLADGMEEDAILHRLYGDQLTGKSFPNAAEIVWIVRPYALSETVMKIEVIGSGCWLDALGRTKVYASTAYAD